MDIGIHCFEKLSQLSGLIESVDIRKILNLSLDADAVRDMLSRHGRFPLLTLSGAASTFTVILLTILGFRTFIIFRSGTRAVGGVCLTGTFQIGVGTWDVCHWSSSIVGHDVHGSGRWPRHML
eukprot:Skav208992  [mRNA]  locus=scaffold2686:93221:102673:- [translate_table: standard]